ncbi:MAG: LysR family transcriptional regulator [Robiginitomaculum sp.]|nr:MAG: LysR family transcriptional regulator [Robiginitomaculum sp.]
MKLRHIEVFHTVYRYKSVSKAARKLNVSQPAVSKALQHAEDQIGFALFTRTGRGLVPTQQADLLFDEVSKVYAGVARVQRTSQDLRKALGGRLKISTVTGLSYEILPRAVARVRKSHPTMTFELQTLHYSDLIASLREFDTHIGLVFDAPGHVGLVRKVMGKCEYACVYKKHRFSKLTGRLPLKRVLKHDIISLNPSGPLGGKLWEEINSAGENLEAIVAAESCFVAKNLAARDVGVAIVDEFTASASGFEDLSHAKLKPGIEIEINVLYLEASPLSTAAKVFLEAFKTELDLWQKQNGK